jgi:hypothetical protein
MLSELFNSLQAFVSSHDTQIPSRLKELETHSREVVYWHPGKRNVEHVDVPPKPRNIRVDTLPDLVQLLAFADSVESDIELESAVVFVDFPRRIQVVFDHGTTRQNTATMPLRTNHIWRILQELSNKPSQTQAQAIRLFRQALQPFDVGAAALLAAQNIRLNALTENESVITSATQRMSRSIQREAAGGSKLPEIIKVHAYPFDGVTNQADGDRCDPYPITVFLDIDFEKQGFVIEPNVQDMEDAMAFESERIKAMLIDQMKSLSLSQIPVFVGSSGDN